MPQLETTIFGDLEVTVDLSEQGEIESITANDGTELDLRGVKFEVVERDTHGQPIKKVYLDIEDILISRIEDRMAQHREEVREFCQARGRDRLGE